MMLFPKLMESLRTDQQRDQSLDALRGLAAFLVLVSHTHLSALDGLPFDLGKFGICVFFIISGYIIPNSFKATGDRSTVAIGFVVKRFFRLYPSFWVSLALGLTMPLYWHAFPGILHVAANVTMVPMMLGSFNILGVYWTLQFELIFYFLCLILYLCGALKLERTAWVSMCLFLAVALGFAVCRFYLERKIPVVFPMSLAAMFLGNILRHCREKSSAMGAIGAILLFVAAEVAISAFAYQKNLNDPMAISWIAYAVSYGAAPLIFILTLVRHSIDSKIMVLLGTISYSFYLVHLVALSWLDWLFPYLADADTMGQVARLFGASAISFVISATLFEYIEHPSIELGRRSARSISNSVIARRPKANA